MLPDNYTLLSVYEGNIKSRLFFTTKKEAVDFWKKQSKGLPVGDPFRYILRDNRKAKNIKDSWNCEGTL